ncbi:MAG: phosphotransferase [Candidatus Tritonobacter lacicola]|nr:phosphotransferase [Candidatus Tritonobacter lacicola]
MAEKLRGDASDREFYRLRVEGAGSAVLMVLAGPHRGGELPFINIGNHLAAMGVSVPELYAYDEERGLLLLEDAGDFTLQDELAGKGDEVYRKYYRMAIDELGKIHYDSGRDSEKHCVAFDLRFNAKKFMWELDFFIEHTLQGYMGLEICPADLSLLRQILARICDSIAGLPTVLTHRDYHSRNLLVRNGRLVVVDFQDARLGPCQYDLASLLRDSYVVLDDDTRDEMMEHYISVNERKEGTPVDRRRFRADFDLVSVQRCLKAAGTFGYMYTVKGNDSYLKYLKPAFANVREIIAANQELATLGKLLLKYIDT